MDQGIKKYIPVALGKHNAFMAGNCGLRGFGQRREAEICKAPAFQRGRSFYKFFGVGIHTKP
jgi:hypothetical protein